MFNQREYGKQWYIDNREELRERRIKRYINNKEQELKQKKEYYISNKEKILECQKRYMQTNMGKIAHKRHDAHHRQLGFTPLNKPFEDCEGHHISENFVIYIPKIIHKSIIHNIWNWKNMNIINKLAIEFI